MEPNRTGAGAGAGYGAPSKTAWASVTPTRGEHRAEHDGRDAECLTFLSVTGRPITVSQAKKTRNADPGLAQFLKRCRSS